MEYTITETGVVLNSGLSFDLVHTFECGQCFRWTQDENGVYSGIASGKELTLRKEGDNVILNCSGEDFNSLWKKYFDIDNDYNEIRKEITDVCPALRDAVNSINGIRILSQEPWEALCSFIISQNNNIPRIRGIVTRLCESFGEPCGSGYSFPPAEKLAPLEPEDLAALRAGFRAKYIIDAARQVAGGNVRLYEMTDAPIDECRTELMKIKGVGAKVAECTLLYGLHRLEAFPIDVWMKKALESDFAGVTPEGIGRYAGIAQQYIFHYTRNKPESSE